MHRLIWEPICKFRRRLWHPLLLALLFSVAASGEENHPVAQHLFELVKAGSIERLESYLSTPGVTIDDRPEVDKSLLDYAAELNQVDIATYLLDHGASINAAQSETETSGATALHRAVYFDRLEVARLLIRRGADLNAGQTTSGPPMLFAASGGHRRMVELLLESGANPNAANSEGKTSLMQAVESNQLALAELLVQHGASLESPYSIWAGDTPLLMVLRRGNAESAIWLLSHGAKCDVTDIDGFSTLYLTAAARWLREDNALELADKLIECGANVNAVGTNRRLRPPRSETALWAAIDTGKGRLARKLIAYGAQVTGVDDQGISDFHLAAEKIHDPELLRDMIKRGAKLDAPSIDGVTPYLKGVLGMNLETVQFLIASGVNVNEVDRMGNNALIFLIDSKNGAGDPDKLIDFLVTKGIDINAHTKVKHWLSYGANTLTPLAYAALQGRADMARMLLEHGARVDEEMNDGMTPLEVALLTHHENVAAVLTQFGAKHKVSLKAR